MRLLHTADWHLGRTFHRAGLEAAQSAALDALVAVAADERPDVVVVAGDLFDRAIPPVAAVALGCEALVRLAEHAPVLAITGNHDSAGRLGPYAPLIAAARVHLRSGVHDLDRPLLVDDAYGPVAVYGIPYLEPDLVREALGATERGHAAVLDAAMARVRADLATRPAGTRCVVAAHAFVHGGEAAGSERDIDVGGVSEVPTATFDGVDYLALGHLHLPHRVGERGRYAGSPVAYSFAEARIPKSCTIVELDAAGSIVRDEQVALPVWRAVASLRGPIDELLADSRHEAHETSWVRLTLTDPERPEAPMERLRRRFPHVLVLEHDPQGRPARERIAYAERLRGRSDLQIAEHFVDDVRDRAASPAERDLLERALSAAREH